MAKPNASGGWELTDEDVAEVMEANGFTGAAAEIRERIAMAPQEPARREQRRTHLDASVVPVERALNARATSIEQRAHGLQDKPGNFDRAVWLREIATEFRVLAEELHFW